MLNLGQVDGPADPIARRRLSATYDMTEQGTQREHFLHFLPIQTRWNDMDKYGHINNMVYYGYFDTAVTEYIVRYGGLDTSESDVVGLVVESHCNYFRPLSFPDVIECGVRVGRLGRSSVRYEIGVFSSDADSAAALGHFVHVYVTRHDSRPTPVPSALRAALEPLVTATG